MHLTHYQPLQVQYRLLLGLEDAHYHREQSGIHRLEGTKAEEDGCAHAYVCELIHKQLFSLKFACNYDYLKVDLKFNRYTLSTQFNSGTPGE